MADKKGRIVFMPDMDYIQWVNKNSALIDEIIKTGRINMIWLNKGNNKKFLIRALKERGYSVSLD